jgi:excisionase family DNA binding protein
MTTNDPPALTAEQVAQIAVQAAMAAVQQMQPESDLKLYTTKKAAEFLGKTPYWVEEKIRDGEIPYTRVGRTPMLSGAHIRAIHAQGEFDPANPRPKNKSRARIKRVAA